MKTRLGARPLRLVGIALIGGFSVAALSLPNSSGAVTQTYNYTGGSQSFSVPSNVTSITLTIYGGAGGGGGDDGRVGGVGGAYTGYVYGTVAVTAGSTINIYVGSGGSNGTTSAGSGGGAGGINSLTGYDGGRGGNAGGYGYSGGGGGGGAASVVVIADQYVVAGGGGGAGGGNNIRDDASNQSPKSGSQISGTNGASGIYAGDYPVDGGGGGGGGGGSQGGSGGQSYKLFSDDGEKTGFGGYRGSNSVISGLSGSTTTRTEGQEGQVVITYKTNQTITFNELVGKTLGTGTFGLSATATSGLAVSFTSATTGVCTLSGSTVTLVSAGTCTINANQAGNTDYNAAAQVQRSFTVSPAPAIAAPSSGLSAFEAVTYSLDVSATGGQAPLTYSLISGQLPAGLSLNPNTGVISGVPNSPGSQLLAVRVTDANGVVATTSNFSISVVGVSPIDLAYVAGAKGDLYTNTNPIPTANNAAFTAEAWTYGTQTTGTWRVIFGGGTSLSSEEQRFLVGVYDSGQIYIDIAGAVNAYFDAGIQLNRWTHIAVSVTGAINPTVNVFVDGVLVKTFTGSYSRNTLGSTFTIGSGTSPEYLWRGQIDQVKIWGSVLDAGDIAESMHSYQKGTRTAGDSLLAHYDFNEFTQGVVPDRTGNGKNLTLASSITGARFTSSQIIETGTAHSEQSYVKFKRSYLTATGGWTPPAGVTNYKALVVAGGGGGGAMVGGGGGAGGLTLSQKVSLGQTGVGVVVGQGGRGAELFASTDNYVDSGLKKLGSSGQGSTFGTTLATGGGRGATHIGVTGISLDESKPKSGGSGGGGGGVGDDDSVQNGAAGTPGQGFSGGTATGGSWAPSGGGGASQQGSGGTASGAGKGGDGVSIALTGQTLTLAGGGGGGAHENSGSQGNPGAGGGGSGALLLASSGEPNTGGGGGGAGGDWRSDSKGGSGGSGVVILSWGPYLEVTQSPTVARAGDVFRDAIKLHVRDESTGQPFTASYPVTVTASANVLTLNSVLLTQSYTVQSSAIDGTVDFSGLGFASNVSGPVTLTFTSDQFVGTSVVVSPRYFPSNVEIKTSGTTGGEFFEGNFYATTTSATTIINASDLISHLASYSTTISASGSILVMNGFESQSSSDLVLKARGAVDMKASQTIRTHGGAVVLWADSDSSGGGEVRLLDNSEICTAPSGVACSSGTTGGGDIFIGGGAANPDNPNRPIGYAQGSGSTYASDGSTTTTGVQLGRLSAAGTGPQLYSSGGDITIKGQMRPGIAPARPGFAFGAAIVGGTSISSGVGKIFVSGKTTDVGIDTTGGDDGAMYLGAWDGGFTANSLNTASDAIVFEGIENPLASTKWGLGGYHGIRNFSSAGGLIFRADHIRNELGVNLSVSGQLVFESYSGAMRDDHGVSAWTADLVNANGSNGSVDANGQTRTIRLLTQPSGLRIGSASNSNKVILNQSFSVSGDIEVYAGSIDFTSDITIQSTSESAHILLKAKDWIDIRNGASSSTHKKLQTNNGDIIIWTDADGSGAGSIYLGTYNELNSANGAQSKTGSGGGRITLAGSYGDSGVDADGHPLGAISDTGQVNGTASQNYAYFANDYHEIYSGGGDVVIRATSNAAQGAGFVNGDSKLWSGTGTVKVNFSHLASHMGVRLESAQWISAATASPAIEISTTTAGNYEGFYGVDASIMHLASTATTGGGISISATSPSATNQNIEMWGWDILSKNGPISITTNGYANWNDNDARNFGAKTGSDVTSSSANINIVVNGMYDNTANSNARISTSGDVSFKPFGSNFALDYSIQFEIEAGSFDFGKIENVNSATTDVTFLGDVNVQGGITVSAQSIVISAGDDLVSTGNQHSIFLKAESDISAVNGSATTDAGHSRVQTNNGDIIFWADSDGDATGGIRFGNYSQINSANGSTSSAAISGGGDVIFAGGTSTDSRGYPTGFAGRGAASNDRSVQIAELTGLYTGGGDVYVRGKAAGFGVVMWRGLEIFSGTGRIDIEGESSATDTVYAGVAFVDTNYGGTGGPLTIVSAATSSPAVRLSGSATTGVASLRLWGTGSANVIQIASTAESGGGIELSGMSAASSAVDINLTRAQILSRNGSVTISSGVNNFHLGTGNNVFGSSPSSDYVTTSSADVNLISDEWDFDSSGHQFNTSGDVSVLPYTNNYFAANTTFAFATDKIRNLTIGKPPTVGDSSPTITITGTHSVSGAIRIYGGTLNLAGTSNYLRAAGTVSMVANGDIDVQENITTFGGPIVLWSNADGTTSSTGGGRIDLDAAATLTSNGGDVLFGGGTSANYLGYPTGNAKSQDASALASIDLHGDIDSSGGDVIMRAEGPSGAGIASLGAITMRVGSQISSGAGDISISGRVPSDTTNTGNQWGLWFGTNTTTDQPTITSTTGDISLLGDATAYISNARNNRPGIVLYSGLIQSDTGDISIEGRAAQHSTGDFVDITGWTAGGFTISSSGDVTIAGRAGGTINLKLVTVTNAETLSILTDSLTSGAASNVRANRLVIDHALASPAGTSVLETPANLTIQSSTGDLVMGSSGVGRVLVSKAVSISGNVQVQATKVSLSAYVFAGGNSPSITISADVFDVSASVKATGGNLALLANTAGRGIMLGGTTTSALLQVSDSELDQLFATNLRIGDSSTADIFIAGDISISSSRVTNLLLRSAGDVIASPGAEITAQNIAVEAGGIIDLIGDNVVSGNVALSASSGVSYSSVVSYSPAAVAEFVPVFGIGVAVSQTNSPTVAQANEFLAVTFNPPPQFVVTDSYSNTLDLNNRLAASFTVSATVTQGTGTVTGRTASFSAGVYSFNNLRVDTNPGTYSFTITVDDGISPFTTSSVDYNVQSGDPQQLIVTATDSTAPSGQASFSYAVSVQDQGGNAIVAGTNANITVSASVSGGVLVSGGQVRADNTGTATFTDLVITGSVSSQISISFFVEFTNNNSVLTTVSSAVSAMTLTPGTATQLRIDDPSQSVANRSTLSALVVDLLDAQGNIVYDRTDGISVSIGSGSGATLVGTDALSFTAGAGSLAQLTFSNLSLQGTVGSYRLDFESDQAGIASVSHEVTLTHGAPSQLAITQGAAQVRSGIQMGTQPRLALRDLDGNLVPSEASISATVQVGYLSGTTSIAMVDGLATYSDLVLTGTAGTYTIGYSVSAPVGLSGFSFSEQVTLTAGEAARLFVAQRPSDVVAGVAQAVSVSVQVLDSMNNLTTVDSPTEISLSLVDYFDQQVLQTTSPVVLPAGQSTYTYSNLVFTSAGNARALKFTSSALTSVSSQVFAISAAAPHHLEWVQNVSAVANDLTMSPAPSLRVVDAYGNWVVSSSAETSISVSVIVGGANVLDLSGGTARTSNSSLVTLDDLVLRAKVGSYKLRVSAINPNQPIDGFTIDSDTFEVNFGAAVSLTTSPTAMNVVNRVALSDISVSVLDSAGNVVTNNTDSITPAISGLTLSGSAVSAVAGVATFSGLVLSGTVGDYDLGFSATGITSATTSITLTHGAVASVELTVSATAKNAQALASQPVVKILDADGNLVSTGSDSVQSVELAVSSGTLTGTTAVSASGGIATFSGIALLDLAGTKTLSAEILSPSSFSTSEEIELSFGEATKLTLETSGDGAASGIALTTQPVLKLRDSSNNIVTGVAHDVVATITPAVSSSGTTVSVNTNTGTATFTALSISGTVGSYSISFAIDGASASSVASVSQSIELGHGIAQNLRVVSQPTAEVAGVTLSPLVVEVIDARGNRVTTGPTSSKTISVNSAQYGTPSGTLSVSLSNGVATFDNLVLTEANPRQRLGFIVVGFTADSTATFQLSAAAPKQLDFSTTFIDRKSDEVQPNDTSVRVLDEFGNLATATSTISVAVKFVSSTDSAIVTRTLGFYAINPGTGGTVIQSNDLYVRKVGSWQLQASSSGLVTGYSNTFTVSNAAPYAISFVQQPPASVQSGVTISPVVEMKVVDAFSNPVLDATVSVTVTTNSGAVSSIVGGTAQNTLGDSRILFPNLAISGVQGSAQLRFTGNLPQGNNFQTANIQIIAGTPYQLSVSPTTLQVVNRGNFPEVVVKVLDRNGNLADSNAQITAAVSGATLSGTVSVNALGGIATFSALALSGTVDSYSLDFSANGLVSVSKALDLEHGAAAAISMTVSTNAKNAQALASQPVVKIFDADGNLVSTGSESIQSVELSVSSGSLTGTTAVSASGGIATFSGIALLDLAGTKTLSAEILSPNTFSTSEAIELSFGAATKLTFQTFASGASSGIQLTQQPVLALRDSSNNLVTGVAHDVVATIDPAASLSGETIAVNTSTGLATFTALSISGTVNAYSLSFAVSGASSSDVASVSQILTLGHGEAASLRVVSQPTAATAGVTMSALVVELLDSRQNRVVSGDTSSKTITVVGTDQSLATIVGTTSVSLSQGVATFSNLAATVGANQNIKLELSVAGLASNLLTSDIYLSPAAAHSLIIATGAVANVIANQAQAGDFTIRLEDVFGNITSQSDSVSVVVEAVKSSDDSLARSVGTFTISPSANSVVIAAANFFVNEVDSYKFRFSATGLNEVLTSTFSVTNAPASKLVVLQDMPATIQSGISFSPAVRLQLQDAFDNPVLDSTVSVSVSAAAGSVFGIAGGVVENTLGSSFIDFPDLAVTAASGSAQLTFNAASIGTPVNGTSTTSATFNVIAGNPYQLSVSPTSLVAASRITMPEFGVKVLDFAGNPIPASNVQISAAVTGATLTGTTVQSATSAITSFSDLVLAGTNGTYTLNLASVNLVGAQVQIELGHGAAHSLDLSVPASSRVAQTTSDIVVKIFDQDNNLVTSGDQSNQTVELSIANATLNGTTRVSASAGIATFSNVAITGSVSNKVITATIADPSIITDSETIALEFGNPYSLDLTQEADGFANREAFSTSPEITVRDVSGNVVQAVGMDIRITVTSASISGSITSSAATGVATFANDLVLRGLAGAHTLDFTAEGTSSSGVIGVNQAVVLNHGAASQLVVSESPAGILAGIDFATQPALELQDPEGNRVSTSAQASGQVVVSYTGNDWTVTKQGVDLSGTTTLTLNEGQGRFSDLRLSGKIGNYSLKYTYQPDTDISVSEIVTVEPGTENKFNVLQQPQNIIAGQPFAQDVAVELVDAYYNRVTRLTQSATVRARLYDRSTTPATIITYSEAVGAVQGVVTFSGLTFTSAGDRYLQIMRAPGSSASDLLMGRSTNAFSISHAAASSLSWVVQPQTSVMNDAILTGVGGNPQIRAFDEYGNLVNTGTVSMSVVGVGANVPTSITGGSVDGVAGNVTFTALTLRAPVGIYDLEFRATTDTNPNVFATLSHQVEIVSGVPTQLTTSAHATSARAGIDFSPQPEVRILDSAGNLVSNSSLVVYASVEGATLVGSSQLAATNGVSAFSGLQLTGSASSAVTFSYEISYQSNTISMSVVIPLLAGDAASASLSWGVTDIQTRVAPQTAPLVELYDLFGNKVLSDSASTASAKLMRYQGDLITESPTVFSASSGEIEFSGLALKATPGSGYYYQFEVAGLDPVSTSAFVVLPGPVAQVKIHQQPQTIVSGVTTTRTGEVFEQVAIAHLLDIDDNIVTTVDSGDITAAISTGSGGTLINTTASISNGVATFTNLKLEGVVETPDQAAVDYRLKFSYGGFDSTESDVLRVKHNIATQLTVETPAAGGTSGADFTQSPVIKVRDRYNNWVWSDQALTIDAELFGAGSGAGTVDFGSIQTTNGVATLSMGIAGPVENTYTLRYFTDGNPSQSVPYLSVDQPGITITHGQHEGVRILQNVGSLDVNGELTMIGEAFHVQPIIEVIDGAGNRVLNYTGVVVASISSQVRGERDYLTGHTVSAVAGVATFSNLAMVGQVFTDYTIFFNRENRNQGSAVSTSFQLTHGLAEYLTIETEPDGGNKTGSALSRSPIVAVRDFDGNIATTLNGPSVSAAILSGGGYVDTSGSNTDLALVANGLAQFSNLTVVALPGVEQTLGFTLVGATNSASAAVASTASATFSLIVADPFQLSVSTQPCTGAGCAAGPTAELLAQQPIVAVQDRFGNLVPDFVGEVSATINGSGGYLRDDNGRIDSRSAVVSGGYANFTDLRIEGEPGSNYSLQFETTGLQSTTSQNVQVMHTTPSQIVITQQPVGGITGQRLDGQPVLEVRDRFGNLAVTDNTTEVTVSVLSGPSRPNGDDAELSGTLTVTASNGIVTFTDVEMIGRTGQNHILRFSAGSFTDDSQPVVLSAAGADRFQWVQEPVAQRTGEVMGTQPRLLLLDFDGNVAVSTSAVVTATVTAGGGYIEAGTTSAAVNGEIDFSGLTLVATPNTPQTLTFTATTASGSFAISTTTPLTVEHTSAASMSIDVSYAASNEQGQVLGTQPVLRLYDRFNNPTVNDNSTVVTATIGSGLGGEISGSATATAVGGVVTFAGLAITGSPGVDYTIDFSAGGYGVSGATNLRLYKTAALEVSYSNVVYSASPTVLPAIAYTDSTEHSISYSVSTPQYCTVNPSTGEATIVSAGTCQIRAEVLDGTYYNAIAKDVTLVIEKAQQDPVVISNNAYVDFGQVLTLTSTGGSSTATTRFFATGQCQILGDKLITFGNATQDLTSSCTVLAQRAGDNNYFASTAAPMDIEVRRVAQQNITIGNARDVSVGDVSLFILGGSGTGSVSYQVQLGTNSAQCSIVEGVLSAQTNGSCEVVATKDQSVNYNVATSPAAVFTFTKQTQAVTITSPAPAMPLPGTMYQVVATSSGATTISYTVTRGQEIQATQLVSASAAVCQLSQSVSGQVLFLRSGTCEITATAAASDRYASATAKISIQVGQLNQQITFNPIADREYGSPAFRLTAVASSGLPVSYTVSAGVSVCSIDNGMVTLNAAGTCEIRASQAGNGSYAPAPNVIRSFEVTPGQASSPTIVSAAVGNQWFTVGFNAPSYDGGSEIIAYRLEVRDQSGNTYVSSSTNTQSPLSMTAVGIPNNVPYSAKVAAITAAGIGQYSNTTTNLTPSPAAMSVTQLSAETTASGLEMSWVTPAAVDGNFQRYEVYAWVTGTEEPQSPTMTLTDSSSDEVTIATANISNVVSISPAAYVAPRLQIVQPLYRPNPGIYQFGVARTAPVGFFTLASISQPATESATVGYTMRVVTITDTYSSSQVINTANGFKVGLSAPSAPTQFNIDTSEEDKLTITWAAPNSDGGFPLLDYQVTSNGQVICANLQTRICEVNPLADSTTYEIEVQARNALGFGEAAAGSHTTPTPPPISLQSAGGQFQNSLINIPLFKSFMPKTVRPGQVVSVTGEKLDTVYSVSLGNAKADFISYGPSSLSFKVPLDTKPGSYNVIHTSSFGQVTVMDAIFVLGDPVDEPLVPKTPEPEAPVSPEKPNQGTDPELPLEPGVTPGPDTDTEAESGSNSSGDSGNQSPGESAPEAGNDTGQESLGPVTTDSASIVPKPKPESSEPDSGAREDSVSEVALPVGSIPVESPIALWLLAAVLAVAGGVGLWPVVFPRRNR